MNWLWFNANADLARWEARPFSATVELGPRPGDKRDNHERVVAVETPGLPEPNGPARGLADAILRFDIFPPRWLASVRRRTLIATGDTRLTDPTTGSPLPTARPLFIRQNGGPRLIGHGTCS